MSNVHVEISKELIIKRFSNGIKLLRPDRLDKQKFRANNHNLHSISNILQLSFPVYFEDINHTTIQCNEVCAEKCGFESITECIGEQWFKPFKQKTVAKSIFNDKEVVRNNEFKIVEEEALRKDKVQIHTLSIRMPWYNHDNKIVGLFGCSILLGEQPLADSLWQISKFGLLNKSADTILSGTEINSICLSKRETECLRLTIRGKSAKQVSYVLGISQRTVEEYLNNTKLKFGVLSKSELIDKAIDYFHE